MTIKVLSVQEEATYCKHVSRSNARRSPSAIVEIWSFFKNFSPPTTHHRSRTREPSLRKLCRGETKPSKHRFKLYGQIRRTTLIQVKFLKKCLRAQLRIQQRANRRSSAAGFLGVAEGEPRGEPPEWGSLAGAIYLILLCYNVIMCLAFSLTLDWPACS